MEDQTTNLPATTTDAPAPNAALTNINQYLADEDPQNTVGKLLKFTKGEFLKGMDAEVIPEGAVFTFACDMALVGWVRWKDGRPAEHKLVRIASGAPLYRLEELGHDDESQWELDSNGKPRRPWQQAAYIPVMDANGEISTFTTGSMSGIKSVHRLLRRYATHAARHPDVYPSVRLKKGFWMHSDKAIGKIFFPDFEPSGWVDRKEFVEALELLGVAVDTPQKALPKPEDEMNDEIGF